MTNKTRAKVILFAVLMATSVFAGAIALSGSVAASQSSSISANPPAAGATSTHNVTAVVEANDNQSSFNRITVDYSVASESADVGNVDQSSILNLSIKRDSDGSTVDVDGDISGVSSVNNDETLEVDLTGNYQLNTNDTVFLSYDDVTNPAEGTYDTEVAINAQSTDNPSVTSLQISASGFSPQNEGFVAPLPTGDSLDSEDETNNSTVSPDTESEVADLRFGQAGNVSEVYVDLSAGANASNVSVNYVDSVRAVLYDGQGNELANKQVPYDSLNETVAFDNPPVENVQQVQVLASINSQAVTNLAEFDAVVGAFTNPTGQTDTSGTQTAQGSGFLTGRIADQDNRDIVNATVQVTNQSRGVNKSTKTNSNGDYTIELPEGRYDVDVFVADNRSQRFTTADGNGVEVRSGDTTTRSFILRRLSVPERLVVEPESAVSVATGDDPIVYTVTAFDQFGDPLQSGTVDAARVGGSPAITLNRSSGVTNVDGKVQFEANADEVSSATLEFSTDDGPADPVQAEAQFILNGEGTVQGEVQNGDTTAALNDANVYAVFTNRFYRNKQSFDLDGGTSATIIEQPGNTESENATHVVKARVDGQTAGEPLSGLEIDYRNGNGSANVSEVDPENVTRFGIDRDGDDTIDDSVRPPLQAISSNGGERLELRNTSQSNLTIGDVVIAEYNSVNQTQTPGSGSVVDAPVDINPSSPGGVDDADYQVRDDRPDTDRDGLRAGEPAEINGTTFFRMIDADTGRQVDNDDYRVQINESARDVQVGLVEELNTSNRSIGEGFAVLDRDGDDRVGFTVTPLDSGNYTLEASPSQQDASRFATDEPSENFSDVRNFTATADNTLSEITRLAQDSNANLVDAVGSIGDGTEEDGNYVLTKLFADGQVGVEYVLVAEKPGFSRDFVDVRVFENGFRTIDGSDGGRREDGDDENFVLFEEDLEPDFVNLTKIGTIDTGETVTPDEVDEFSNQSDAFCVNVSRDGTVVQMDVQTRAGGPNGEFVNGTVTVEIPDNDSIVAGPDENFDGQFLDRVDDGQFVRSGEDTITLATGDDGNATVYLETDQSTENLVQPDDDGNGYEGAEARLVNDPAVNDETCLNFVGVTTFRKASLSGIVTDTNDDPIPDSAVWTTEFRYGDDADDAQPGVQERNRFDIDPDDGDVDGLAREVAANATDELSDDFTVKRQVYDVAQDQYVTVETATVSAGTLQTYDFNQFPSVSLSGVEDFKLYTTASDDVDASFTLDPVPAVANLETKYRVEGVKLDAPKRGNVSNPGRASVVPGTTDDANVVIPIDVTLADVTFEDQSSQGDAVTVQEVVLPNGGFIAIHNQSELEDGAVQESVIGVSDDFGAGTYENVRVSLNFENISEDQTLVAMPHFDDPDDGQYTFKQDAAQDGPYTNAERSPVTENASITVQQGSTNPVDSNNDGSFSFGEISTGISDFNSGSSDIGFGDLADAIQQFNSGN